MSTFEAQSSEGALGLGFAHASRELCPKAGKREEREKERERERERASERAREGEREFRTVGMLTLGFVT